MSMNLSRNKEVKELLASIEKLEPQLEILRPIETQYKKYKERLSEIMGSEVSAECGEYCIERKLINRKPTPAISYYQLKISKVSEAMKKIKKTLEKL